MKNPKIEFMWHTVVDEVLGDGQGVVESEVAKMFKPAKKLSSMSPDTSVRLDTSPTQTCSSASLDMNEVADISK